MATLDEQVAQARAALAALELIQAERDSAAARIAELSAQLQASQARVAELEAAIALLEDAGELIPPPTPPAGLLFSSGFDGPIAVTEPREFWGEGAWRDITGLDTITRFTWPPRLWGGTTRIQNIVGAPVNASTFNQFQRNAVADTIGRDGLPTRALYSEVMQQFVSGFSQNDFIILPSSEQGDLYIRWWQFLQPDLAEKLKSGNWRVIWDWKSSGDYRVTAQIVTWDKSFGRPYWQIRGDNYANGGLAPQTFWNIENRSVPVPIGRWFKFEAFVHRDSTDGRDWMAVDGQVIADRRGSNIGVNGQRINRIILPTYSDAPAPVWQFMDDIQIWDRFPPDAAPH